MKVPAKGEGARFARSILTTEVDGCQDSERILEIGSRRDGQILLGSNMTLERITFDDQIMGGRACIRGMRIPVSVVLKMLAGGLELEQILADYPDLEREDVEQCIQYAALLADEQVATRSS
jgi:uncharacterized protein (DUF433 family)